MASYHHGEQAPNPVFCYASLSLSPELRFAFSVTAAAAGVAVSPSSTTRVFVLFYSGNCKKRKFIFQKKNQAFKKDNSAHNRFILLTFVRF